MFCVDVKDFEHFADPNIQHNFKPLPIRFINIFFASSMQKIQKRTKGDKST